MVEEIIVEKVHQEVVSRNSLVVWNDGTGNRHAAGVGSRLNIRLIDDKNANLKNVLVKDIFRGFVIVENSQGRGIMCFYKNIADIRFA